MLQVPLTLSGTIVLGGTSVTWSTVLFAVLTVALFVVALILLVQGVRVRRHATTGRKTTLSRPS